VQGGRHVAAKSGRGVVRRAGSLGEGLFGSPGPPMVPSSAVKRGGIAGLPNKAIDVFECFEISVGRPSLRWPRGNLASGFGSRSCVGRYVIDVQIGTSSANSALKWI
jgi:hypothetical protein